MCFMLVGDVELVEKYEIMIMMRWKQSERGLEPSQLANHWPNERASIRFGVTLEQRVAIDKYF